MYIYGNREFDNLQSSYVLDRREALNSRVENSFFRIQNSFILNVKKWDR